MVCGDAGAVYGSHPIHLIVDQDMAAHAEVAVPAGVVARIDLRSGGPYPGTSGSSNRDGPGCSDHAVEDLDGKSRFALLALGGSGSQLWTNAGVTTR